MALLSTQATYDLNYVSDSHTQNASNISAKVGDKLYKYCLTSFAMGSGNMTDDPEELGIITRIRVVVNSQGQQVLRIGFNYTSVGLTLVDIPGSTSYTGSSACDNMFLSFKKDCGINISSLAGYYASVTFVNDDYNHSNELFAIGAQVGFSSK
tara:strand:+ start:624 stop:1082 length:459 start_codon:yes stop_codon:yes gene_type:complete